MSSSIAVAEGKRSVWVLRQRLHDHRLHLRRNLRVKLARRRGIFVDVLPGEGRKSPEKGGLPVRQW